MTRSIFDPTGGEAERSGSRFTPPDADQISHMPESFTNPPAPQAGGLVDFQPPPETEHIAVRAEDDGKLMVIHLSGKLSKDDYQKFVPMLNQAIERHGQVRLLVEMQDFHGWNLGGFWEDVKFDLTHFNKIERVALIGDAKWEKWMAAFCKPFTSAEIRYFSADKAGDARAWAREQ